VISSNHAVAKGVIVSPDALHISYVHSPMRYAWDLQFEYLRGEGLERGLRGLVLRLVLHRLRMWDVRAAAGVDHFIANSAFIARRILKAYRREADVIHPPVDMDFFTPGGARGEEYVAVSRLFGYKRVDLLLEAFGRMPGRRLVIVGDGPQRERLRAAAPPNVEFSAGLPPEALRDLLRRARAFVFPAIEDFGIAPVEALACGTPVIALRRGGAAETVDDSTGVFFEQQTPEALIAAIERFEANPPISAAACRHAAERFSAARFRQEFEEYVRSRYAQWRGKIAR
jgi:glycosyltransferase involved in cell wall biosynthesis